MALAGEQGVVVDFGKFLQQTQAPLPRTNDLIFGDMLSRPSTSTDWYRTNNRFPLETAKFSREAQNVGVQGWRMGRGPESMPPVDCIGAAALAAAMSSAVL